MELKQDTAKQAVGGVFLLIVPYGIETNLRYQHLYMPCYLLIVPYGIETYIPILVFYFG